MNFPVHGQSFLISQFFGSNYYIFSAHKNQSHLLMCNNSLLYFAVLCISLYIFVNFIQQRIQLFIINFMMGYQLNPLFWVKLCIAIVSFSHICSCSNNQVCVSFSFSKTKLLLLCSLHNVITVFIGKKTHCGGLVIIFLFSWLWN